VDYPPGFFLDTADSLTYRDAETAAAGRLRYSGESTKMVQHSTTCIPTRIPGTENRPQGCDAENCRHLYVEALGGYVSIHMHGKKQDSTDDDE